MAVPVGLAVPGRLLDLTRLISRVGHGPMTGVDRVERAYLSEFLARPDPVFGLVATSVGHSLLDRAGMVALSARLMGQVAWGKPDLLARFSSSLGPGRKRAEADVRRLARGSALPQRLGPLLAKVLPGGVVYYNTGHANLTDATLGAVKSLPGARIAVLIHDMIPLDFPLFTRPGQTDIFADKMRRVAASADRVICNSAVTAADVARHFAGFGRVPDRLVAHLGIDPPTAAPALPADHAALQPYFLCLGTIEPRKNHALLLDLWDGFAADPPAGGIPHLLIAGSRGWRNEAVFARLDRLDPKGPVRELAGVGDEMRAALMANATGLLFPSLAEGFGLPPAEAAARGIPVLCNDLAVLHEILGDYPVYAPVTDSYHWRKAIETLTERWRAEQGNQGQGFRGTLPGWADHFNLVLNAGW